MPPPPGPISEAAHAAGEAAKVARASPRFAIAALACVAALGLVLGFVYLLVTRPDPLAPLVTPLPTVGDWMTRGQFREELDQRDRRLSPATNEALGALREEIKAMRAEAARDRAEMRAEITTQGTRIDRILELVSKPR